MDVTQLALTWVGWPNGKKLTSTCEHKLTQVHARRGQKESQVDSILRLVSESIRHPTRFFVYRDMYYIIDILCLVCRLNNSIPHVRKQLQSLWRRKIVNLLFEDLLIISESENNELKNKDDKGLSK